MTITTSNFDLKQWVKRYLKKKYDEIFHSSEEFERWAEFIVEFVLFHYNEDDVPSELLNDYDAFQSEIAKALIDELTEYSDIKYVAQYIEILNRYYF